MKIAQRFALLAGLTSLLVSASAMADSPVPPPPMEAMQGPHNPEAFMAQMKVMRGKMLREDAKLDEAAAVRVEKVLDQFDAERKAKHMKQRETHKALMALLKADSKDEKAYKEALDGLTASHRQLLELRSREFDEMRKVLSQREAAHVLVALEKAMRHRGPGGPGMRGMHHGPPGGPDDMDDEDGDHPAPPPPPPPPPPARKK